MKKTLLFLGILIIAFPSFAVNVKGLLTKSSLLLGSTGCAIGGYNFCVEHKNKNLVRPEWIKKSVPNGIPNELNDTINYMGNPEPYKKLGIKPQKGILLYGPPGTGKTTIARTIAQQTKRKFIYSSGSELTEMYYGRGAERIRKLFKVARECEEGSIIFIDEIDTIARPRSMAITGTNEQLSEFLNQLDGFEQNDSVLVIAATNTPNSIDKALLRPGRLGKHIHIGLPDFKGRKKIINHYLQETVFEGNVKEIAQWLSRCTANFSGADLQGLINDAKIIAVRNKASVVTRTDFINALQHFEKKPSGLSRLHLFFSSKFSKGSHV